MSLEVSVALNVELFVYKDLEVAYHLRADAVINEESMCI